MSSMNMHNNSYRQRLQLALSPVIALSGGWISCDGMQCMPAEGCVVPVALRRGQQFITRHACWFLADEAHERMLEGEVLADMELLRYVQWKDLNGAHIPWVAAWYCIPAYRGVAHSAGVR